MPEPLTLADFAPRVGAAVRLPGVSSVTLVLAEATASSLKRSAGAPPGAGREPFSLIFRGPLDPILPQQIHAMEIEGMDPLDIFIVPIGPIEGGMGYQAIFN